MLWIVTRLSCFLSICYKFDRHHTKYNNCVQYLQEVSKCSFLFWLLLCNFHGTSKVINKVAVYVQNNSFGKWSNKHIPNLLLSVPLADTLGQSDAEQRVALQDLWYPVEQCGEFGCIHHRWFGVLKWLFVFLMEGGEPVVSIIQRKQSSCFICVYIIFLILILMISNINKGFHDFQYKSQYERLSIVEVSILWRVVNYSKC